MTTRQERAISMAQEKRARLVSIAEEVSQGKLDRHCYVFSPPGLGKSFTFQQKLKDSGVKYKFITGTVTPVFLGAELATLHVENTENEKIVIVVDDCESILNDMDFCNILKNVLDGTRQLQYNKLMKGWLHSLSQRQRTAIESLTCEDSAGFIVPTDNFVFVFLSNIKLPTETDLKKMGRVGKATKELEKHRNAIRSRCKTIDFALNNQTIWGWIADVVLESKILERILKEDHLEKGQIILDWLFNNADNLTELSIRTVEKMAEEIKRNPINYVSEWEDSFMEEIKEAA
jgi:hypothetical protein